MENLINYFYDEKKDWQLRNRKQREKHLAEMRTELISNKAEVNIGMLFALEDGPQFVLQMLNSLLIGQSWQWLQVISPMTSAFSLVGRYIKKGQDRDGFIICLLLCSFVCWISSLLIIVLTVFSSIDNRPDWVKQMSLIKRCKQDARTI